MKQKLILVQGIPASGKSTWAKQYVLESPLTRVRVNRDDIRRMLGKYWVTQREGTVDELERHAVFTCLEDGYDVVLDATNLNLNYLKKWVMMAHEFDNVEIEYKPFYISLEEALERDNNREESVGEEVITNFYNKYNGKF